MNFFKISIVIVIVFTFQSCSSNPSGRYSLGVPGSKAWFSSTSYQDKLDYFNSLSTIKLCHIWKIAEKLETKELIGASLVDRGKDEFFCAKLSN